MGSIQIGCGQITWVRFGPNGAEWLAPEEDVLGQVPKRSVPAYLWPEDRAPMLRTRQRTCTVVSHLRFSA